MGTDVTCVNCATRFDSDDGFLRPEGFLCGACYRKKCEDPAYVEAMERQLAELVSALSGGESASEGASTAPLEPRTPSERLACESLIGLAVGDALGARYEGAPFDLERSRAIDPARDGDGVLRWTDDTQMALSIVECLAQSSRIDPYALAAAFARRYESWRGYGSGMHSLLPRLRRGGDWRELNQELFPGGSFGNGSAMRVAPLGAYFHASTADVVVEEAARSAEVTHAHPEARVGAAAVALAAWLAARSRTRTHPGAAPAPDALFEEVLAPLESEPRSRVTAGVRRARELASKPDVGLPEAISRLGNGSDVTCADTVPLALWIASRHLDDFPAAIDRAIAAGGDTDTVAAIVGGIVASRTGVDGIPKRWRHRVEKLPLQLDAP